MSKRQLRKITKSIQNRITQMFSQVIHKMEHNKTTGRSLDEPMNSIVHLLIVHVLPINQFQIKKC